MSHFANCLLLLVRSGDDVPRACRDVGEFLAFQRARLPTVNTEEGRRLVGIWVDPVTVDTPPEVWGVGSVSSARRFRIRETVGMSGIWCLCWLDVDHGGELSDPITLRETMVSALIKQQPSHQHPSARQFYPVFDADDDNNSILLHTRQLREVFPGLIAEPMSWDSSTGALTDLIGGRRRN